jgi:drug/metabolite transporter (DMT)-like permease
MAALATMSKNTLGAAAAVIGALCFSVNDATIKFLSSDFSLPQMMFLRSAIAIPVILLFFAPLARERLSLRGGNVGLLAIRGVFMVLANMTFFLGLAVLPLAEVTGVFFISPLVILVLSVVFLKERAGPWRWGAVIVGLLGVLYMLQLDQIGFSGGFQVALILPLLASVFYAIVHVITRSVGDHTNATTLAFYLQFCFFVIMGILGLAFGGGSLEGHGGELFAFLLRPWFWPSVGDVLPLLLIGCAVAGYNYFISQA